MDHAMTRDAFWALNEDLPTDDPEETLVRRLAGLEPDAIRAYQRHFDAVHAEAYAWPLWGAAYLIGGGCSDDGFVYFRSGLIARGRAAFEAAVADPDGLAAPGVAVEDLPEEAEGLAYAADEAHEERTGEALPPGRCPEPAEPTGEAWDFDDEEQMARRLPRLWALLGGYGTR